MNHCKTFVFGCMFFTSVCVVKWAWDRAVNYGLPPPAELSDRPQIISIPPNSRTALGHGVYLIYPHDTTGRVSVTRWQ